MTTRTSPRLTATGPEPASRRPRRRPARPDRRLVPRLLRELGLTVAAALGTACIVFVVCAVAFDVSLVMFRTGSMTPAIPSGSVAVIRQVPAVSVEPGDVVTVARPGRLPITHRVVAVEPHADGAASLTLKGDANPGPDPEPYEVRRVGKVVGSLAGVAKPLSLARQPGALAVVTVAAAALVTWAFWPARAAGSRPRGDGQPVGEPA